MGVSLGSWDHEDRHGTVNPSQDEYEEEEEDDTQKNRISSVYSMAVHSEALWLAAGLHVGAMCILRFFKLFIQSGSINLYSVRFDQGACFHTLRGHSAATSCIEVLPGESSLLSGSWDKSIMVISISIASFVFYGLL